MRLPGGSHVALSGYVGGLCLALVMRPQPLVLIAAAVAAAVWATLSTRAGPAPDLAASPVPAPSRRRAAWRHPAAVVPLLIVCGVTVGAWRLTDLGHSELKALVGERGVVVGEVQSLSDVKGDRGGLDLLVTSFAGRPCREKVRLQIELRAALSDGDAAATSGAAAPLAASRAEERELTLPDLTDPADGLVEGTIVIIDAATIEALPEAEPGEFDYGRYLRRRGQHVMLTAPLADISISGRRGGLAGAVDGLRLAARRHLRRGLRAPVREVLEAMVLGDDNGVDQRVVDDFRCSGLLHIMAVSGENVVLLCAIAGLALRLVGVSRGMRMALLVPVVCTYVVVTGASPSIVRAGVAGVAGLLATLVSRPADGWLLLLLPGAYLLTVNPNALFDVSFQLSFAAVVGLLTLSRPLTAAAGRLLPAALAEQAGVTTAASIATAPVSIITFGSASVVSVAANLAAGFVLGPIMLLGMISVLVGFVSTWLSLPLNYVAGVFIGFMLSVAALFGRLPFAVWEWHGVTPGVALVAALALEAVVIVALAHRRRTTAGDLLREPLWRRRLVTAGMVVVALALLAAPSPPRQPTLPTLTMLDVGEGAATLLQVPGGPTVLFDAGPEPLADTLRRHAVERIDLLVLSHGHADHTAGLVDVLGRVDIGRALVPEGMASSRSLATVVGSLAEAGVPVTVVARPLGLQADQVRVALLPTSGGEGGGNQGENDRALVCVVTLAGARVLLPGDAEGEILQPLELGYCAIVALPHHGSAGGFTDDQLAEMAPELAVIPVGENRFGHPTAEMLDLLTAHGIPCLRTDRDGEIALTATSAGLRVAVGRE